MVGAHPLDLAALKADDPVVNAVRSKRRRIGAGNARRPPRVGRCCAQALKRAATLERMIDNRPEAERLLVAGLMATAKHHAN
jgi:hypothetical protein